MRNIVFGAFLVGLTPACLLLSPLDEATPDFGYAGNVGSGGSGGKGSAGSAGKGNAGSAGKGSGGASSGGNSGSGGAPPAAHTCDDPLMIDDMEAPEHTSNICQSDRVGGWYVYSDGSGMTTPAPSTPTGPPFPYTALDAPRAGSTYAVHVTSTGQTTYGGMGVSLGYPDPVYDATAYAGIQFWAKGQGTIDVQIPTVQTQPTTVNGGGCVPDLLDCSDNYEKTIMLTPTWQQYTVQFGELAQQGWGIPAFSFFTDQILTIEFAWAAGASADIWIDDLRFLEAGCDDTFLDSCPTTTTYEACWYNSPTTFTCPELCTMLGLTAGSTCTPDAGCDCGLPSNTACATGATFICDCYEYAGSPCTDAVINEFYRGCFRAAQGYEGVLCSYEYAVDPLDPSFIDQCLYAEAECLQ